MKKEYLECGKIINTHGVAGAVKIDPWCDSPEVFAGLKRIFFEENGAYRPVKLLRASVFKRFVIATLEGVDGIDTAETLRETVVYAHRDDLRLNDGDHFISDLIDLPVIDFVTGKNYGRLCGVINNGASDIYEVETPDGVRMIPAVPEFVKRIDVDAGIFISPIEGMFD